MAHCFFYDVLGHFDLCNPLCPQFSNFSSQWQTPTPLFSELEIDLSPKKKKKSIAAFCHSLGLLGKHSNNPMVDITDQKQEI